MFQKGDIVIVRFPFTDSADYKKRPALVISNKEVNKTGDYLMVQITSKEKNDDLTLPIDSKDYDNNERLPLKSFIRLHKIFLLNENPILSKATTVKTAFIKKVTVRTIELIK
jgi:mRNA-degrading endonuclease toxin of MazEF toxin-antitoxin module